ncbi:MAG: 1-acyl-sn-glycerol-3-phosphate acyltransferase [Prevotellaceae bacterium]|jgi:1-acyl-sn-glycerol-3-phosphate acyltransferase|nr:1-acyl-sn-glycerol-3-phosphate acyltransferase [Prevotellaceae bacterium]
MKKVVAIVKFILFWLWVALQLPVALALWPFGRQVCVWHAKVVMFVVSKIGGIRVRVHGKLADVRPLLLVGNHISVFEFAAFPVAFGGGFFGKHEISKIPIIGWLTKRLGVIFVSRKASDAAKMVQLIDRQMSGVTWPMVIYPEGTTSNGSIVLPFKSSMFDFIEKGANIAVQPMVMLYRSKHGNPIDDKTMANDYAYFDNAKMPAGAALCRRERSAAGQLFHILELGGFMVEFHLLPPVDLAGLNRKEMAAKLHHIVENKFMELKEKKNV